MKRIIGLLLVTCLVASCRNRAEQKPASASPALDDAAVVLQIDGDKRTNADFKEFIRQQYPTISPAPENNRLLSRLFDQFVEQEMILYQARREGVSVNDEEVSDYAKQLKGDSAANAAPPGIRPMLIIQKYLYFRVYKDIQVSDREVEQFYNSRIEDYRKSEEILLYQILVLDHDKAVRLRSELLSNPNRFEEIARRDSQSPEAGKGGQMGYFERGVLPKEMENIVFSLQVNEISPITQTPYGYHIFKVTKIKKKRLLAFANVSQEIHDRLLSERLRAAYQQFLADLRQRLKLSCRPEHLYFAYVQSTTDEVKHDAGTQTAAAPADPAGRS